MATSRAKAVALAALARDITLSSCSKVACGWWKNMDMDQN
jgi:hypothetical protein